MAKRTKRTTVEVDPIILKALHIIARRRKLKVKAVSNGLMRFAIPYERDVFAIRRKSNNKDNGR